MVLKRPFTALMNSLERRVRNLAPRMRGELRELRDGLLYLFRTPGHVLRDLRVAQRHEVVKVVLENLERHLRKVVAGAGLDKEAFLEVAGADAERLESLQHMNRLGHGEARVLERYLAADDAFGLDHELVVVGEDLHHRLVGGALQKAVLVEAVDEVLYQVAETLLGATRLVQLLKEFPRPVPVAELVS